MSLDMRARMETNRMRMRSKKHPKPMMEQHRMWRTEGRVGVTVGKNDLTRRVTHREAVFGPVIHSIIDAWHYEVLWTCELTRLL